MRNILRLRWLVLMAWIVAAVGLMITAPNMEQLVREKGQISVPDGYSSAVAGDIMRRMNTSEEEGRSPSTILVLHRPDGLTAADHKEIREGVASIPSGASDHGITAITSHYDQPDLEKQLVSEDGTTVLMLVEIDFGDRNFVEVKDDIYAALQEISVEHYYTGNWLIGEDVVLSSQEGLKKTEWITLVFILVILFIVFRSAVAPLIPLITVGFTYLVSQSIVAYLVEYVDFPLSTFTQIFMVAVLFGIGTDYCILLISRFKEELAHTDNKVEAIVATYRAAGRTVFFSGLAVLVGFTSIGFSTFVLFQSAVAVAVGIAVLLIALVTLVPFFMMVLGKSIFWPARGSLEHKESRLWDAVGRFSLRRPLQTLLILIAVTVPALIVYQGSPSFNSLNEIGERYESVKGFNIIADSFGPGETLPTTVVVESDTPMDTQAGLAVVEQVSRELAKVNGVKTVRSATRPIGEALVDLQVTQQVGALSDGVGDAQAGLGQIGSGLSEASVALSSNAPQLQEAVDGAGQLIAGTNALKQGLNELGNGLRQIEQGLRDGSAGAGQLKVGLQQAQGSAERLAAASAELLRNYEQIGSGLNSMSQSFAAIVASQKELGIGLSGMGQGLQGLAQKYPQLQSDTDFIKTQGALTQLLAGSEQLSAGLQQWQTQFGNLAGGIDQANAGFAQAADGQMKLAQGLEQFTAGIRDLEVGLVQASGGQGQIVKRIPEITGGVDQIVRGQKELQSGFAGLTSQLGELTSGLDQSVDGLNQVSDGLLTAQDYLQTLSRSGDTSLTGWYIPETAIGNDEFQAALNVYMSEDRRIAKFEVVFNDNPYDLETLLKVDDLEAAAMRGLQDTSYAQSTIAIGGESSINNDLRNISAADYNRTMVLMLIGITLILIVLFRSIVMPIYLVLSLLLTYYTSVAIAELLFVRIIGLDGISWAVPFFGFVMLMALGIDYSIFLMDRFKEYRHLDPQEGILLAMKKMGTVIMSAAVILGGTFAAMLPSGVMSLMQIATIVLSGLLLYALVMLPLFIPVMVRTFGSANWWPNMARGVGENVPTSNEQSKSL